MRGHVGMTSDRADAYNATGTNIRNNAHHKNYRNLLATLAVDARPLTWQRNASKGAQWQQSNTPNVIIQVPRLAICIDGHVGMTSDKADACEKHRHQRT